MLVIKKHAFREQTFVYAFIDLVSVKLLFLKKVKSFLVKGFYLKFVENVRCILNDNIN